MGGLPASMLVQSVHTSWAETFCPKNLCLPPPLESVPPHQMPHTSLAENLPNTSGHWTAFSSENTKGGKLKKWGLRAERQKEAVSEHSMERASLVYFTPFLNLNTWHKPLFSKLHSNITMINNDSVQFLYSLPGFAVQQTFMRVPADQNGEKKIQFCFRILSEPLSIFRQENICRWTRREIISVDQKILRHQSKFEMDSCFWLQLIQYPHDLKHQIPTWQKQSSQCQGTFHNNNISWWMNECNVMFDHIQYCLILWMTLIPGRDNKAHTTIITSHRFLVNLTLVQSCTSYLRAEIVTVPAFLHS